MKAVGARVPRYDGIAHVTGRTVYVDDVRVPGMLWAKALRSPVHNGAIKRLDTSKAEQLPGARDIENPAHREYIASVWGCDPAEIPGRGLTAEEIMRAIHAGEIKGLLSICFNPAVSLPQTGFTAEALDRLEFFGVVDFFLSETAFHADVVLPGSLHEEDEGVVCTAEGRVVKINAAVDPPGDARHDWRIYCDLARRLGRAEYFPYTTTREIFEELRVASKGGIADYAGITWERCGLGPISCSHCWSYPFCGRSCCLGSYTGR